MEYALYTYAIFCKLIKCGKMMVMLISMWCERFNAFPCLRHKRFESTEKCVENAEKSR